MTEELKNTSSFKDLVGQRFGLLKVISLTNKKTRRGADIWHTVCDCGGHRDISSNVLGSKKTILNCGCVKRKGTKSIHRIKEFKEEIKWLKKTYSHLFYTWEYMRNGCNNYNHTAYSRTGFKGIKLCEEWDIIEYGQLRHGFKNFLKDMQPTNKPGLKLNRRDLKKDFNKYNCYWATSTEIRRREDNIKNRFMSYQGKRQHILKWADDLGIARHNIKFGYKNRWSMSKIIAYDRDYKKSRESFKTDRQCHWCGEVLSRYVGPVKYQKKKYCSREHYFMYSKAFGRKKGLRRALDFRKPANAKDKLFKMATIKQVSSG